MDSVSDEEIQSIWKRQKKYFPPSKIRAVTRDEIEHQIKQEMEAVNIPSNKNFNPQSNQNFLIRKGFPSRASEIPAIQNEILSERVSAIKVKGKERFKIKKGTGTFEFEGKKVKAGQFLKGKTQNEAVSDLKRKALKEQK